MEYYYDLEVMADLLDDLIDYLLADSFEADHQQENRQEQD
jgi:hypothetical protein